MATWLVSSSVRRPARSISEAASSVPPVLTAPTTMLPTTGDARPACANTWAASSRCELQAGEEQGVSANAL